MIFYYKAGGQALCPPISLETYRDWLAENTAPQRKANILTGHQVPGYKQDKTFKFLSEVFDAQYRKKMEGHFGCTLDTEYLNDMAYVSGPGWTIFAVERGYSFGQYYLFDFRDEALAVHFKLANL